MMRKKRNIAAAIFVSSGVFGLVHGTNIFVGADPLHTLIQVVTSFMLGIVLGGMFLFSGNIIVPIAIHTIHDILAIGVQSAVTEEGVVTASVTVQTLIEDAALVLLFAFVIYFIFILTVYATISRHDLFMALFPIHNVAYVFSSCFLIFY